MLKLTAETFIDLREEEEELMKQLEAIHNGYVEIGVLSDAGNAKDHEDKDSGVSLVTVASVHEYGSEDGTIPQRSFIGSTMDEQDSKFNDTTNKLLEKITNREMKTKQALGIIGAQIKAEIQKKIRSNIGPPLKQSTIDRKGSSVALIDTSQLVNSIAYKVELENAEGHGQSRVGLEDVDHD